MIWNYLKIALRNLKKYKGYSFVNIMGLAVAIAACLLIAVYIFYELSFDNYHKEKDRIYRVTMSCVTAQGTNSYAINVPPLAPTLKQHYPQVEAAARLFWLENKRLVRHQDKLFYEQQCFYADPDIFTILTIPFLQGDAATALDRPAAVVITEKIAVKYFGNENAMGKILQVNGQDHEVTGIIKNAPPNSHLSYSMFTPLNVFAPMPWMNDWTWPGMNTYVKLAPGVDAQVFESQIRHLAQNYLPQKANGKMSEYIYFLQPITDIHLQKNLEYEIHVPVNVMQLYIFAVVGLLILIIASVNFINLATARATTRSKEVGLRKVIGAKHGQLVRQFLGESFIITFLALAIALLFIELSFPILNSLIGTQFLFSDLLSLEIICAVFLLTLFVSFVAGLYPAFFLAALKPATIFKGKISKSINTSILRKILVVGQFTISIMLIISTLIIYKQLHYMKHKNLGFDKEQKLVVPVPGRSPLKDNYETIKQILSNHPAISGVTVASNVPGTGAGSFMTQITGEDEKKQMMFYTFYDDDFIPQYHINMLAGRSFQREITSDMEGACIINQAAVTAFGWRSTDEAIGKRIKEGLLGRDVEIIGVTEDFHYRGVQQLIEPLVIQMLPMMYNEISLKVNTESIKEVLDFVETKWQEFFPDKPFEYFFLDQQFNQYYWSEEKQGKIIGAFTVLGLLIACLGLFSLSAFSVEQRSQEIGVRKVLGASLSGIMRMLSIEFIKWVMIANIVAWPIAYFIMSSWLQNFAYRTNIEFVTFIVASLLTLLIAQITISYQAIKAAIANPVKSLRYE